MKNSNSVLFLLMFILIVSNCSYNNKSILSEKVIKNNDVSNKLSLLNEIIIPFKLVNKLVLVKAEVDNKIGHFIFDTGAKNILLNKKYFKGRPNHKIQLYGHYNENKPFTYKQINFNWINDRKGKKEAFIIDMEEIEKLLQTKILGYVGYSVFYNKEVVFDFIHQEITLYVLNKEGKRISNSQKHLFASDTISIHANGFLPYLNVEIANQNFKLGIDSGTTMNLLRIGIKDKIEKKFKEIGCIKNMAFDGTTEVVPIGIVSRMTIKRIHWNGMKHIEGDIDFLNKKLPIPLDGLLGFEFLKAYKTSINYKKLELYIWQPDLLKDFTVSKK